MPLSRAAREVDGSNGGTHAILGRTPPGPAARRSKRPSRCRRRPSRLGLTRREEPRSARPGHSAADQPGSSPLDHDDVARALMPSRSRSRRSDARVAEEGAAAQLPRQRRRRCLPRPGHPVTPIGPREATLPAPARAPSPAPVAVRVGLEPPQPARSRDRARSRAVPRTSRMDAVSLEGGGGRPAGLSGPRTPRPDDWRGGRQRVSLLVIGLSSPWPSTVKRAGSMP